MVLFMPATILIVDDDPDMVELLRLALKDAGYTTRTANSGIEALSKAQRFPPDLILLDVILPDLNGFNVCDSLRHHPATASVPIIMVTVLPGEFPRLVGTELGADAYLNKPFQIQELISRVGEVLRQTCACPVGSIPHQVLTARREVA